MKNSLQIHASPRGCQPVTRHPHRSPLPADSWRIRRPQLRPWEVCCRL